MISMTGFAFAESTGAARFSLELKSYNNRYLDLVLNLPPALSPWEPALRDWLAENIGRGRVEFTVRMKNPDEVRIRLNNVAVDQYVEALTELKKKTGIKQKLTLEHFLGFADLFSTVKDLDNQGLWESLTPLRDHVLKDYQRSREVEGQKLEKDIRLQLEVIGTGRGDIASQSEKMEVVFRENLKRKFEELAAEPDENRILSETALLLIRYGINEELVRLASHIEAFERLLTEEGPVGKKLDFLCQEIGREINTIGSKTTLAEVQQKVVAMKDALENVREQLRNVE